MQLIEQVATGTIAQSSISQILAETTASSVGGLLDELLTEAPTRVGPPIKRRNMKGQRRAPGTKIGSLGSSFGGDDENFIEPGSGLSQWQNRQGNKTQVQNTHPFKGSPIMNGTKFSMDRYRNSKWPNINGPAPKTQVDPETQNHGEVDWNDPADTMARPNDGDWSPQVNEPAKPNQEYSGLSDKDGVGQKGPKRPSEAQVNAINAKITKPVLTAFQKYLGNFKKNVEYSIGKSRIPAKRATIVKSIADNLYKLAYQATARYNPTMRVRNPGETIPNDAAVAQARKTHGGFWKNAWHAARGKEPFEHGPLDEIQ